MSDPEKTWIRQDWSKEFTLKQLEKTEEGIAYLMEHGQFWVGQCHKAEADLAEAHRKLDVYKKNDCQQCIEFRNALTDYRRYFADAEAQIERMAEDLEKAETDLADYKRYFTDAEVQIELMAEDLRIELDDIETWAESPHDTGSVKKMFQEALKADLADYKRYFADAEVQIELMAEDLEWAEDSLASERIRNALAGKQGEKETQCPECDGHGIVCEPWGNRSCSRGCKALPHIGSFKE